MSSKTMFVCDGCEAAIELHPDRSAAECVPEWVAVTLVARKMSGGPAPATITRHLCVECHTLQGRIADLLKQMYEEARRCGLDTGIINIERRA